MMLEQSILRTCELKAAEELQVEMQVSVAVISLPPSTIAVHLESACPTIHLPAGRGGARRRNAGGAALGRRRRGCRGAALTA